MENDNLFDLMDDAENVRRKNEFEVEKLIIQEKNIEWFKKRPGLFDDQEHDQIGNHIRGGIKDGKKVIGFWPDSELPDYIRKDINDAADRCFL